MRFASSHRVLVCSSLVAAGRSQEAKEPLARLNIVSAMTCGLRVTEKALARVSATPFTDAAAQYRDEAKHFDSVSKAGSGDLADCLCGR
jgi:hypothetical protein